MSQNGPYSGPPWSHGSSDEPYAEPADPWGESSVPPDPSWGGHSPSVPHQPAPYQSAPWSAPAAPSPPPPRKRNTPIIALVVTLGVLICVGLGTTAWLIKERTDKDPVAQESVEPTKPGPAPQGSEDARFNVKEGECVINDGSDDEPEMRTAVCTSGTYEVLKRITGKTTGEKDAESKCSPVKGYTKWYFYDSPLDDLDFVLCLKEHKAL